MNFVQHVQRISFTVYQCLRTSKTNAKKTNFKCISDNKYEIWKTQTYTHFVYYYSIVQILNIVLIVQRISQTYNRKCFPVRFWWNSQRWSLWVPRTCMPIFRKIVLFLLTFFKGQRWSKGQSLKKINFDVENRE